MAAPALHEAGTLWGAEFIDGIGRWALKYLNAIAFFLATIVLLAGWMAVCYLRKRKPTMIAVRAIVLGMLELYLAVTVWAVFITWPPAWQLLTRELLMAVGLVAAASMVGSGAPRILAAFQGRNVEEEEG